MLVAAALLLVLYVTYWWTHRHLWIHGRNLPGPRWLPFIGNLTLSSNDGVKNFQDVLKLMKTYGSLYRMWMGPKLYVFTCDPEVIGKVLRNPRVRDHDALSDKSFHMLLGNSLVAMSGDAWAVRSKLVAPAFNRKLLETYVAIFAKDTRILANELSDVADGQSIDISNFVGRCAINSIMATVIGVGPMKDKSVDHRKLSRGADLIVRRILQPWLLIDWIYKFTSEGKEVTGYIKDLHEVSEGIIAEKQDEYRRGIKRSGLVTSSDKKINSFLDMMLEASESQGCPLSAVDLQQEVANLAVAATGTTSLTISYCLLLIAIHKAEQDKIHQELDDIFAGDQRLVTAEDLNKMVVLERAIKETMRYFPPGPYLPRLLPEDIPIGNGRILPKDSVMVICSYNLHRNEEYFKDANSFLPDRWFSSDKLHPFAYMPFAAGVRTCPGRHYAMLQMKCTLSTILRQFQVSTDLDLNVINSNLIGGTTLGLNPDIGFRVKLKHLNSSVL